MTDAEQVKSIILMMSPEDAATQTDAVFLVNRYITKTQAELGAKDKQIALLEAQLATRSQEKHDIINEKLASETRLKKEKDDLVAERNVAQRGQVAPEQKPAQPKEPKNG